MLRQMYPVMTGMVAGTKYRGDFEERVKNALSEVSRAGDILLFIDELHNLIGAGAAEDLEELDGAVIAITSRGKPIRPKTAVYIQRLKCRHCPTAAASMV